MPDQKYPEPNITTLLFGGCIQLIVSCIHTGQFWNTHTTQYGPDTSVGRRTQGKDRKYLPFNRGSGIFRSRRCPLLSTLFSQGRKTDMLRTNALEYYALTEITYTPARFSYHFATLDSTEFKCGLNPTRLWTLTMSGNWSTNRFLLLKINMGIYEP